MLGYIQYIQETIPNDPMNPIVPIGKCSELEVKDQLVRFWR